MTGFIDSPKRWCPVCDTLVAKDFKPGPGGRPDASCPNCGSLERHRFLAILLACLRPTLGSIDVLLDVAPSAQVTPMLGRLGAKRHVRLDLGADNRLVDILASLTDAPFAADSVDLMVCFHVLEHIPDDRKAMREIARMLRPGGVAILQVPWRRGTRTDEDPDAPEDVRIARFGQRDHVRYYGDDFEDRLVEAGLSLRRVTPRSLLGESMCTWLKLGPTEMVWLASPNDHAAVPPFEPEAQTHLTTALDALIGELGAEHAAGERERRRAEAAEATVWESRGKPILAAAKDRARPLVHAARRRFKR
ncbi:MAG: class I SAM-dependent methyltransferase [Jatrophihabitantaceae bacterium]